MDQPKLSPIESRSRIVRTMTAARNHAFGFISIAASTIRGRR
jgi:hypothetical protein